MQRMHLNKNTSLEININQFFNYSIRGKKGMIRTMANDYEMVIGLEVHSELSTKTKIFCSCPTEFGAAPNTHVCPICMAMPGTLPVLNEKVVEYAVKAGLATNCEISNNCMEFGSYSFGYVIDSG